MVIKSTKDLQAYREDIIALAQKHGADNVRVFGSVARGTGHDASDVDLLVTWNYDYISAWGGVGLDAELEALLGCSVDVISEAGLSPLIREHILAEAIPL